MPGKNETAALARRLLVRIGDWASRPAARLLIAIAAGLFLLLFYALDGAPPGLGHFEWITGIEPETGLAWTAPLSSGALNEDGHPLDASLFDWRKGASSDLGSWACRLGGPAFAADPAWFCAAYWQKLGPPHQLHDAIRQAGGGGFSVWHGVLYFSVPGGTDPRDRSYALWIPWTGLDFWLAAVMPAGLAWAAWPRRKRIILAFAGAGTLAVAARLEGAAAMLAWSGVLLAVLHMLPRRWPRRRARLAGPILALAGFLAAEIIMAESWAELGLVPQLQGMQMLKYLVDLDTDRPILLLLGSSMTQYGIDEKSLQTALAASGQDFTIVRLGFGGMSTPERLFYLRRYLATARHKPAAIWFEVSAYYDLWPLKQLEQNRYSLREIAAMDADTLRLSLGWALGPDGPPDRWPLIADLIGHFALRTLQIGFLPSSVPWATLHPASFAGVPPKTKHVPDALIAADLAEGASADQITATLLAPGAPAPATIPSDWAAQAIDEQIGLFRAAGITRFGFYAPPSRLPDEPAYARQFCRAMTRYPCIPAEDSALLAALGHDEDWLDDTHLQGPGRELYTAWLAARLAASAPGR